MRWAALLGLLAVHVGASSTPLSIGLETGWPAPHPILELLYVDIVFAVWGIRVECRPEREADLQGDSLRRAARLLLRMAYIPHIFPSSSGRTAYRQGSNRHRTTPVRHIRPAPQ